MRTLGMWLRGANDVLHDYAAGVWPGAVAALWFVRRGATDVLTADQLSAMVRGWTWILWVLLLGLLVQVATGMARIYYRNAMTRTDALTLRGRIALAKHAVFVTVFVASAVAAFSVLQA